MKRIHTLRHERICCRALRSEVTRYPPGYVGYDAGGELTNAIREKPFSVVLFDEIEKAHPRILDKFLQVLDDGVLTSGRGERVYFSEAFLVFTSNLGLYRMDESGHRVPNASPSDDFETMQSKVRSEINRFFKLEIGRPEILNRIGENIVVFDFIRSDIAHQIFEMMLSGIFRQVEKVCWWPDNDQRCGATLTFAAVSQCIQRRPRRSKPTGGSSD